MLVHRPIYFSETRCLKLIHYWIYTLPSSALITCRLTSNEIKFYVRPSKPLPLPLIKQNFQPLDGKIKSSFYYTLMYFIQAFLLLSIHKTNNFYADWQFYSGCIICTNLNKKSAYFMEWEIFFTLKIQKKWNVSLWGRVKNKSLNRVGMLRLLASSPRSVENPWLVTLGQIKK